MAFALLLVVAAPTTGAAQPGIVRAVTVSTDDASTGVRIVFDGEPRWTASAADDTGFFHVDFDGASLADDVARLVPVSDPRVDGVVVRRDPAAGRVRVSIDVAGRRDVPIASRVRTVRTEDGVLLLFGTTTVGDAAGAAGAPAVGAGAAASPGDRRASSPVPASSGLASRRAPGPTTPGTANEPAKPTTKTVTKVSSRGTNAAATPPRRTVRPVVILDPGHGGKDPGATAWTGEVEKDIVLDLATRVARRLRRDGDLEVVMTRSADEYVPLAERRDASRRWGAAAFVSIHANASGNSAAKGIETYFYRAASPDGGVGRDVRRLAREENSDAGPGSRRSSQGARAGLSRTSVGGAPLVASREDSRRLATEVQDQLVRRLGMRYEAVRDLGAKEGPFFVLGDNAAPSVLVEAAFLTHREEGVRMGSEVYREQIADGIARGVLAFLEGQRAAGAL